MSASLNAPDEDWRHRGYCVGRDSEWDYECKKTHTAEENLRAKQAIRLCTHRCPVLEQCRRWILSVPEGSFSEGIVAGMTPAQRKAIRRKAAKDAGPTVTARQKAVLRYRLAGMTNVEIAALMGVHPRSIEREVAALVKAGHNLDTLKPPVERGSCGTTIGRKAHSTHGEHMCALCTMAEKVRKAKGVAA